MIKYLKILKDKPRNYQKGITRFVPSEDKHRHVIKLMYYQV